MMPSFNLLDEKWIPVVMAGGEPRELSLRDALIEADTAQELFDASPLVTAALHRLLLAVLWRVFPQRSLAEWKALWQARRFDASRLDAYFDQWRERFDARQAYAAQTSWLGVCCWKQRNAIRPQFGR